MKSIFTSLAVLASLLAVGQQLNNDYTKTHGRTSSSESPLITDLKNGNYIVSQDSSFIEIDAATGDSVGSGFISGGLSRVKSTLRVDDHIYLGGYDETGSPAVAKVDENYNPIFKTTLYSGQYADGVNDILVDGSDVYATGNGGYNSLFVSKLTTAGDTVWNTKLPQTTFCNLTDIIKLSDGNFLASGHLDDYPLVVKFNSAGDTLWTYTEYLFISFTKAMAFERTSANEYVIVARNTFITLDAATGEKKSETQGNIDYFDLKEIEDSIYLFGTHKVQSWGGPQYPLVEVRTQTLDSLKSYTFMDNVHPEVNNRYTGAICLGGNSFAATGLVRDSIELSSNTWLLMASKFNGTAPTNNFVSSLNSDDVSCFPNPSSGNINFSVPVSNVKVFDLLGNLVLTNNQATAQLNLESLNDGLYNIEGTVEGKTVRFRVILK